METWQLFAQGRGISMKIARIETHVCHARMRNWIFVKVVTDQQGLWGWGEATLEWHTRAVVGAIEDLASLVVGEDPTTHRAPLANDVSPAFLARQWHRPRHGHQRHRHRPMGHPRQDPRRAVSQALGRPGTRYDRARTATSAAGGWKTFTTADPADAAAVCRACRHAPLRKASPRSSRWPCRRRCRSRDCGRSGMPRPA